MCVCAVQLLHACAFETRRSSCGHTYPSLASWLNQVAVWLPCALVVAGCQPAWAVCCLQLAKVKGVCGALQPRRVFYLCNWFFVFVVFVAHFLLLTFCLLARCIASLRFAATFAGSTEFARRQQQQHTTTNKILQNNCNLMKCCSQWSKSRKSKPARMCVCVRVLECVIVLVNVCCVPFAMHVCACMCAQVVRMCDCSMWASV